MCKNEHFNHQRDCYIDKENLKQYINTLDGIIEQDIPPFNEKIKLKDNSLIKCRPDLYYEWDFLKNNNFDIYTITKGSMSKVWWICTKCGSNSKKTVNKRFNNGGCAYCHGREVNHTNSLETKRPDLAECWNYSKNKIKPSEVSIGMRKKVWWLGECGHEWDSTIADAVKYSNCPYCTNRRILEGFNDMWTTNPKQASLLANPEDGYKYMQCSGKKVDWRCPDCKTIIKNKAIDKIFSRGLKCKMCSDGLSYPERFLYRLLSHLELDFEHDISFEWLKNKRYDFYLKGFNIIIECHGIQHYEESNRGRTLKEEQENDRFKRELALQNGIKHYIELDCRHSDYVTIKNSIMNSVMPNILKLEGINWETIFKESEKSMAIECLNIWNDLKISPASIGKVLNLSEATTRKYLKNFASMGICDYDPSKYHSGNDYPSLN